MYICLARIPFFVTFQFIFEEKMLNTAPQWCSMGNNNYIIYICVNKYMIVSFLTGIWPSVDYKAAGRC